MIRALRSRTMWALTLWCAMAGCANDNHVDIGHDVAQLSDYGASWDGYGEAASFPAAGSDRVRLVLDGNGHGTLQLGDAGLLPPPTQAAGGYLLDPLSKAGGPLGPVFRDGFQYPVHDARVEAGRIRFGIDPLELYGAWCALVPPVVNELAPSGYACGAEGGGFNFPSGSSNTSTLADAMCVFQFATTNPNMANSVPVDCGIYQLCVGGGVCTCTASACGSHVTESIGGSLDQYEVLVDAAIDAEGTSLVGTLAVRDGESYNRITLRMHK